MCFFFLLLAPVFPNGGPAHWGCVWSAHWGVILGPPLHVDDPSPSRLIEYRPPTFR